MAILVPERNPLMDLPPMPESATPVLTPGLLHSLGIAPRAGGDFQQPFFAGFLETHEDFCQRISEVTS